MSESDTQTDTVVGALSTINLWNLPSGAQVEVTDDKGTYLITRGKYNRATVWVSLENKAYEVTLHPEDWTMSSLTVGKRAQLHTYRTPEWLYIWPVAIRQIF